MAGKVTGKAKKKRPGIRRAGAPRVKAKRSKRGKGKTAGTWADYRNMEPQECQIEP